MTIEVKNDNVFIGGDSVEYRYIEDVRSTEAFYTQPIKEKTTYNNVLFDGIMNHSRVLSTVIAAGMPVAKWALSAAGFVSREIVELSARKAATFIWHYSLSC